MKSTQQILERIREVLPELKELKFGCEVRFYDEDGGSIDGVIVERNHQGKIKVQDQEDGEINWCDGSDVDSIIGIPVQLNDLLRVIEMNQKEIEMSLYGNIFHIGHYEKPNKEGYYSKGFYNLSLSVEQNLEQNEGLREIISQLIF